MSNLFKSAKRCQSLVCENTSSFEGDGWTGGGLGRSRGDNLDTVRDAHISTQVDGDDFIRSSLNACRFFGSVSSRAAVGGSLFSESEEFISDN